MNQALAAGDMDKEGKRLIFDRHTKGALLTYKQIFTTSKMPQLGLAAEAP